MGSGHWTFLPGIGHPYQALLGISEQWAPLGTTGHHRHPYQTSLGTISEWAQAPSGHWAIPTRDWVFITGTREQQTLPGTNRQQAPEGSRYQQVGDTIGHQWAVGTRYPYQALDIPTRHC